MRKIAILSASAVMALAAGAARAELDYKDYDDDLMRTLERTVKYFEPDITAKNLNGAKEDAAILLEGFQYTEDYFAKKGSAPDAVAISKKGQDLIHAAVKSLEVKDFDGAAVSAREAVKACASCHDTYKPKQSRG